MSATTSLDGAGATVGGTEVPLAELLHLAKVNAGREVLAPGLAVLVVRAEAAERGVTVDDAALQRAADELRRSLGLTSREATLDWLEATGRTALDFDVLAEHLALQAALRDVVIDDAAVAAGHPDDQAVIARLVASSAEEIDRLGVQIRDEGTDFFALADEHSIVPVEGGSRSELVRRADLRADVAAAVFAAARGEIVGPFDHDDRSELIRVDTVLAQGSGTGARDALFERWLRDRVDAVDLPSLAQL